MTEITEKRVKAIAAKVLEQAGEKRQDLAEQWVEDLHYCMEHMDEAEYGVDFLCNLEWALEMPESKRVKIEDRVVCNTLAQMAMRMAKVQGKRQSRIHDLAQGGIKETLMPEGRWLFRGYHSTVRRTQHGYRVEFSAEKNDCAQMMQGVVDKLTKVTA